MPALSKTPRPVRIGSAVLAGLLLVTSLSGCFYSREMARTRHDIERVNPGLDFKRGMSMNLGPFSLRLARWILRRVDDEDAWEATEYLSEVRRVKVGIYPRRDSRGELSRMPTLRRFESRGWELAVRANEEGESVMIYYRERHDTVSDMFAVVVSDDELVVARIEGRLNRLLEKAMSDHSAIHDLTGFDFE
ncbi:MAG: DUF4252 domain-containing protein [Bacteroidetes bacterium]|nr:DUF4252 domain-containing protein [Bacteroidota bacterium]